MLSIFLTILPVFLILGAGYFAARTGYLGVEVSEALNIFTIKFAIPILLFNALYNLDFRQAFHFSMLTGFFVGGFASFAVGIILARTIWKRRPGEAVAVGFSALFSNTVLIGIPITERAYGAGVMAPVFGIVALHATIMYTLGMVTMELARRDGRPLGETLLRAVKSLASNALMIGTLLGALFNLANIDIPEPVTSALKMVATAGIPAALVGLGITLTHYKLKANIGEALMVSVLKLFLQPFIALIITHYIFDLQVELVRAAVVLGATPPGINVYIFATLYKRAESLAASAIIIAAILSVFTISFWIWLLAMLGL